MQSTKLAKRWNRREALLAGFATCAASTLPVRLASAANHVSSKHFGVQEIKRTTVKLPYRPVPQRAMSRELPHWRWSEICEVTLTSGQVGLGETLLYYTWGATGDDDVQRAQGGNAIGLMWDDSLGAGLQSALMDAVAKTASVPIHALFGEKVNARTPLSWWNIDTSQKTWRAIVRPRWTWATCLTRPKGDLGSTSISNSIDLPQLFQMLLRSTWTSTTPC